MRKSGLAIDKCWVTQSGYFRLATTVALGMGIVDEELLYCHVVSEGNVERKIQTLDYNNTTVYEFFSNPFIYDFVSPAFNLPPITFDNRPCPHKRA